jgi:hypothetical protein
MNQKYVDDTFGLIRLEQPNQRSLQVQAVKRSMKTKGTLRYHKMP